MLLQRRDLISTNSKNCEKIKNKKISNFFGKTFLVDNANFKNYINKQLGKLK